MPSVTDQQMTDAERKAYRQGRLEAFAEAQAAAEDAIAAALQSTAVDDDTDEADVMDWATREMCRRVARDAVVKAIQQAAGTWYDVSKLTVKRMEW